MKLSLTKMQNKITYNVNRGVGRPLDFYGLKEQYIIYFVAGIFIGLILFLILQSYSKLIAGIITGAIVLLTYVGCYYLNNKFGVNGLSLNEAMKTCPRRIHIKRISPLIEKRNKKK